MAANSWWTPEQRSEQRRKMQERWAALTLEQREQQTKQRIQTRRARYVILEELAAYREDPANSPLAKFVVCLECGRKLASIETNHLLKHGLISETYQAKWSDAPMVSEAEHDRLSAQSKNHWDKIPPEQRTIQAKERNGTPERRTAQSIAIKNVRAGGTGLTHEELEQWRINAADAIRTPEHRKAASDRLSERWAEQKEKLAKVAEADAAVASAQTELEAARAKLEEAQARAGLSGKPAWMQVAGNYLLDHPEAGNEDIAKHLDVKAKRSDGKRWIALVNSQTLKNDFGDVRRFVGIRGRIFGKK